MILLIRFEIWDIWLIELWALVLITFTDNCSQVLVITITCLVGSLILWWGTPTTSTLIVILILWAFVSSALTWWNLVAPGFIATHVTSIWVVICLIIHWCTFIRRLRHIATITNISLFWEKLKELMMNENRYN